jgi:hypothetical protein
MSLNSDDRNWLDGKFDQVHERITKSENAQTTDLHTLHSEQSKEIGKIRMELGTHLAAPCVDVEEHEERHHTVGWPKIAAFIVAVGGLLTGVIALIVSFWKK